MERVYMQLIEEIEELESLITEMRKEIESYLKMSNVFRGPTGIKGINYSVDKVQSGGTMAFGDAIKKISEKNNILQLYLERLSVLRRIYEKLRVDYEKKCDTIETKVFYLRFIKKYTQKQTAYELGYSERQIQRIEKKLKDVVEMSC